MINVIFLKLTCFHMHITNVQFVKYQNALITKVFTNIHQFLYGV